jgi:predicted nuclease of predicted toxin-antitoxin system
MRFLVDANMPRSALAFLKNFGHTAEHVRDLGLGAAPDKQIAALAKTSTACLVTRDLDFADIRNYPPDQYAGILVLRLADDATALQIIEVLEKFLKNSDLIDKLSKHLVILEPSRVRFRPALPNN